MGCLCKQFYQILQICIVVLRYNQCVGPDAPQGSEVVKKTRQRPNFITLFLEQTSFLHAEPDVRARQLICTTLLPFYKDVMHQHLQKVTSNSKRQKIKMNNSHLHWVPYLLFLSGILLLQTRANRFLQGR